MTNIYSTNNSLIRSDEGPALETSGVFNIFTVANLPLMPTQYKKKNPNFYVSLPSPTQRHTFFKAWFPLAT